MHETHPLMKIIISLLISLFCFSAVAAEPAAQQSDQQSEQLNYFIPKGFKIAYQDDNQTRKLVEIISETESLDSWSRMVTIQTFSNIKSDKYDPEKYILELASLAKEQCGTVLVEPVTTDQQNGFAFSHKVITCEPNKKTGQSEIMNIKAIKGKKAFYVVQVTNRVAMDETEIRYWALYLRDRVIENK
jgi:hypothetical protein